MKHVLAWLGRKGLIYAALFVGIALYTFVWQPNAGEFSGAALRQDTMSVGALKDELSARRDALQSDLETREGEIRAMGADARRDRLAKARASRAAKTRERDASDGLLDSVRPSRILANKQLELEIAALDAEIAALEAAGEADLSAAALTRASARADEYARVYTARAITAAQRRCDAAAAELERFRASPEFEQQLGNVLLQREASLESTRRERCAAAEARRDQRATGIAAVRALEAARQRHAAARAWTVGQIDNVSSGIEGRTLRDVALGALIALLAIIAAPYLIRLIFWFVLAPIAERRPEIRLRVPGGMGNPIAPAAPSATSVAVTLAPGEELLVRQDYLQSTARDSSKATQWLLDWGHPFSSLASGLVFLTRIRGDGAVTGVSPVADPFAEATVLDLPPGASCVLQPRGLAALAQPIGRPTRITSHWRIFSLNAWLTMQLRYLVFHGPARLVVKGGRGVRVEAATGGRIFGQDQLVGFSADLGYAVTRNETFWPYFLGREPLLRDRVSQGEGILVIEEAPMAGRRGAARGSLEGAFDAVLKAFGI